MSQQYDIMPIFLTEVIGSPFEMLSRLIALLPKSEVPVPVDTCSLHFAPLCPNRGRWALALRGWETLEREGRRWRDLAE